MTLEQFAARVQDIAGEEYSEARVSLRRDAEYGTSRYIYSAYVESLGWVGVHPSFEEPEEALKALSDKRAGKTDPTELRHDA